MTCFWLLTLSLVCLPWTKPTSCHMSGPSNPVTFINFNLLISFLSVLSNLHAWDTTHRHCHAAHCGTHEEHACLSMTQLFFPCHYRRGQGIFQHIQIPGLCAICIGKVLHMCKHSNPLVEVINWRQGWAWKKGGAAIGIRYCHTSKPQTWKRGVCWDCTPYALISSPGCGGPLRPTHDFCPTAFLGFTVLTSRLGMQTCRSLDLQDCTILYVAR